MKMTRSVSAEQARREWFVIDAEGKILGRLATEIASRLRGKHKPSWSPNADTGDYIIVINAEKVAVTGRKEENKQYYRHTGYPGGLRHRSLGKLRAHAPERIIEAAVKGMIPHNPLGRQMLTKLKVYAGSSHPHSAQQPAVLELG